MTLRRLAVILAAVATALGAAAPAPAQSPPAISAPSAIVVDARTGDVLHKRAPAERRSIASTTKLMTALLVLEEARLSQSVPAARYRGLAVESKLGLREGERLSVADLLRALLLASANDAAVTLAEHVSGSTRAFVARMNARARELGLRDTRFANPIGLDAPGNHSTAADLAKLTLELREHAFFRQVTDRGAAVLRSGARQRTVINRNRLVREVPWVNGVKTGRTQGAGYVLVGSGRRNGIQLVSVVLGTGSEAARDADTLALLRHGFRQYRRREPVSKGDVVARVPIRHRPGARLRLLASRDVVRRLHRSQRTRVTPVGVPADVEGPIRSGQRIATAEIHAGQRRIARVPLVAANDVPAAGIGRRTQDWFTRPASLLIVAAVAGAAGAVAVLLRRRATEPPRRRRREEASTA